MANGTLDVILTRLLELHPKKIDLSLGRTQRLLEALGNPQHRLPPTIHVAGTNGKGSTIAFMRAMLEAAGKRVHVYTSPHLVRFHERIRLAGTLVSDEELMATLDHCEKCNAGQPITFFEITTAAAFHLFAKHPADVLLLEVGLGGRFDSTNVIDAPLASVITPVSIDHPEFLGTTIEKIALEKAGILKKGRTAILAAQSERALNVIEREAARLRAPLVIGAQDFLGREELGRMIYEDQHGLLDLPLPRLAGRHQIQNAATAIACLRHSGFDFEAKIFEQGVVSAQWPARLQRLKGNVASLAPKGAEVWLDGGHNEDGGRVLGEAMADFEEKAPRPLVLICGTLATKDTGAFLRAFRDLAQEVIAVPIHGDHYARPASDVSETAIALGMASTTCASVEDALRALALRNWPQLPRILIAGSLYLAGEVLELDGSFPT